METTLTSQSVAETRHHGFVTEDTEDTQDKQHTKDTEGAEDTGDKEDTEDTGDKEGTEYTGDKEDTEDTGDKEDTEDTGDKEDTEDRGDTGEKQDAGQKDDAGDADKPERSSDTAATTTAIYEEENPKRRKEEETGKLRDGLDNTGWGPDGQTVMAPAVTDTTVGGTDGQTPKPMIHTNTTKHRAHTYAATEGKERQASTPKAVIAPSSTEQVGQTTHVTDTTSNPKGGPTTQLRPTTDSRTTRYRHTSAPRAAAAASGSQTDGHTTYRTSVTDTTSKKEDGQEIKSQTILDTGNPEENGQGFKLQTTTDTENPEENGQGFKPQAALDTGSPEENGQDINSQTATDTRSEGEDRESSRPEAQTFRASLHDTQNISDHTEDTSDHWVTHREDLASSYDLTTSGEESASSFVLSFPAHTVTSKQDPVQSFSVHSVTPKQDHVQSFPAHSLTSKYDPVQSFPAHSVASQEDSVPSSVQWFQCPQESGFFPHPTNCTRFFWCLNSQPRAMFCPGGTVFDSHTALCAGTGGHHQGCGHTPAGSSHTAAHPSNVTKFHDVIPSSGDRRVSPSRQADDVAGHDVTSDVSVSRVRRSGRTRRQAGDHDDDVMRDEEGQGEREEGEEGRSFGLPSRQVDFGAGVSILFQCPGDGFYADPQDCSLFYHCSNGKAYQHQCQPGTAFNKDKLVCSWPVASDGCGGLLGVPFMAPLHPLPPLDHPHPPHFQCPDHMSGYYPDPDDCRVFYRCTQGHHHRLTCGNLTAFNPETGVCSWPLDLETGCGAVLDKTSSTHPLEHPNIHHSAPKTTNDQASQGTNLPAHGVLQGTKQSTHEVLQHVKNSAHGVSQGTKQSVHGIPQGKTQSSQTNTDSREQHEELPRRRFSNLLFPVMADEPLSVFVKDKISQSVTEPAPGISPTSFRTRRHRPVSSMSHEPLIRKDEEITKGENFKTSIHQDHRNSHRAAAGIKMSAFLSAYMKTDRNEAPRADVKITDGDTNADSGLEVPVPSGTLRTMVTTILPDIGDNTVDLNPGHADAFQRTSAWPWESVERKTKPSTKHTTTINKLTTQPSTEHITTIMNKSFTKNTTTTSQPPTATATTTTTSSTPTTPPTPQQQSSSTRTTSSLLSTSTARKGERPETSPLSSTMMMMTTMTNAAMSDSEGEAQVSAETYRVAVASTDFRCPSPTGHFRDELNCAVYYHCVQGVAYRQNCPPGKLYDISVHSCLLISQVQDCERVEDTESEWGEPWNSHDTQTDHDPHTGSVSSESFECHALNGYFRDHQDCRAFVECINGVPYPRQCMTGTVFDASRKKCTWTSLVPDCHVTTPSDDQPTSQQRSVPMSSFVCPLPNGHYRDPDDCSVFYHCLRHVPYPGACRRHHAFDVITKACVSRSEVPGCEEVESAEDEREEGEGERRASGQVEAVDVDDVSLDMDEEVSVHTSEDTDYLEGVQANSSSFRCPKAHGLYRDPHDCRVFYHCFAGTHFRHQCQLGTVFSTQRHLCTWPLLVPDCQEASQHSVEVTSLKSLLSLEAHTWKTQHAPSTVSHRQDDLPLHTPSAPPEDVTGVNYEVTEAGYDVTERVEGAENVTEGVDETREGMEDFREGMERMDDVREGVEGVDDVREEVVQVEEAKGVNSAAQQQENGGELLEEPLQASDFRSEGPLPASDFRSEEPLQASDFRSEGRDTAPLSIFEDAEFLCPYNVFDQYYRDPVSCTKFHRCVKGVVFTFHCPHGTFFDPLYNTCDHQHKLQDCDQEGRRLTPASQPPEPLENEDGSSPLCPQADGLFPHPTSCRHFLYCSRATPTVLTCPQDLLYNLQTRTCDYHTNTVCLPYDK